MNYFIDCCCNRYNLTYNIHTMYYTSSNIFLGICLISEQIQYPIYQWKIILHFIVLSLQKMTIDGTEVCNRRITYEGFGNILAFWCRVRSPTITTLYTGCSCGVYGGLHVFPAQADDNRTVTACIIRKRILIT